MRTDLRLLIAAIVLMIGGLSASFVTMARAARTMSHAYEATANAAPAIRALDRAQADLRRIHAVVLEHMLGESPDGLAAHSSLAGARRNLAEHVEAYLALPAAPGERVIREEIVESLGALDVTLSSIEARGLGSVAIDANVQHELAAEAARLGLALAHASAFSAELAKQSAADVSGTSLTALRLAGVIDLVTVVSAIAALALTYRSVRRADALATTSRRALEARAEELEQFAARVAHDLLSPLAIVSLALDSAASRAAIAGDERTAAAVARGRRTVRRIRGFVSDLLDFARAGAKPAPGARAVVCDILREVADELAPIARDAQVDLSVESRAAASAVACSPGVLTSILRNLAHNAIKYIGDRDERRVHIRVVDAPSGVRFEVEDTGPGIAPKDQSRLFEPYARGDDAHAPGLGLGLATVRRLVESHGGSVGVSSSPGAGSVFWFALPVARACGAEV